jgi:glycosyltransferase involved in cell wall biosynthesis
VVALGRGGACETVDHGSTGWLVADESPEALAEAMARVDDLPSTPDERRTRALRFSPDRFIDTFSLRVTETLAAPASW